MLLRELFDKPVKYSVSSKDGDVNASFKVGDKLFHKKKYGVDAVQYPNNVWKLSFYLWKDGKKVYDITNTGDEFKVFSAVSNILKDFISSHEINKLIFSSEHVSRTKLYKKLLVKLLPGWDINYDESRGITFFSAVPRPQSYS